MSFLGSLAITAAEARVVTLERRRERGEVWVKDVSACVGVFVAAAATAVLAVLVLVLVLVVVVVVAIVVAVVVAWGCFERRGISTHRNLSLSMDSVDILGESRCLFVCLFD